MDSNRGYRLGLWATQSVLNISDLNLYITCLQNFKLGITTALRTAEYGKECSHLNQSTIVSIINAGALSEE